MNRITLLSSLLFVLLAVASTFASASRSDVVLLDDESSSVTMAGKYSWLEDDTAALGLDDVSSPAMDGRFIPGNTDGLSLGYTSSAIWLKFKVRDVARDGQPWLLNLDYPLLDQVNVYQSLPDGSWSLRTMGNLLPFDQRPILHHTFVTPLELEPHVTSTVLVRIASKSSMIVRPSLQVASAFYEYESRLQVLFGLMYGVILMMALYNAFLYLAVRDVTYLVYVVSVLAGGIFIMSLNGHGYQFLWPGSPHLANTALPLSSSIWAIATALFTQLFIETRRYTPVFHRLLNIIIGLGAVAVVLSLFADYQVAIHFGTALGLFNGLLILTTGMISWYRGNRAARFFTLAWVVYAFGSTTLVLSQFGVVPDNLVTQHSATMGLLLQIIMLSLALSEKYRVISRELEDHARNLEKKIAERTLDLSKASKALKRLSQQDALTKLANRREFGRVLNDEWKRHQRSQEPISLLVCDVDELKELNDHFGHDAGDEALRQFGRVIKESMHRTADHPSRIGGDEFAVILPETDLAGAAKLADDICENYRNLAIPHAPRATYDVVTVSIGVASTIPQGKRTSSALFRLADNALYAAKQQGRDRAAIAK